MKVMKFGGTSVGSAESILNLKKIVEACNEPVIVVVSALGGITDKLINTSKLAQAGDKKYLDSYNEMAERHHKFIDDIIKDPHKKATLLNKVDAMLDELKSLFQGVYLIKEASPKTSNAIVSYGERISSNIAATLINDAKWYDSLKFIKTTKKKNGKNMLDAELTNKLVEETFENFCKEEKVALVPGFISTDVQTGEITNLGRGGSDYTASIIAAALDADVLEI